MSAEIQNPDAPATEKQLDYLQALVVKHDVGMDETTFGALLKTWIDNGIATRGFISGFIDQYLQMPLRPGMPAHVVATPHPAAATSVRPSYYKKPMRPPLVEVDVGFYVTPASTGDKMYYHVVKTRDGQRTYAKVLTNVNGGWGWEYEPGAIRQAAAGSKITLADANRWITDHKVCFVCCKEAHTTWPGRCSNALAQGTQ